MNKGKYERASKEGVTRRKRRLISKIFEITLMSVVIGTAFLGATPSLSESATSATPEPTKEVSGLISTDTVWTGGYTYVVTGNTLVEQNVTLTIEHGTTVKFSNGCYLRVDGNLQARGLPDQMISFTSAEQDPQVGDWGGIWISEKTTGENLLKHCIIEYASEGPGDPRSSVLINKGHIDNCIIRNNRGRGIVYGNAITLTNSTIEHNVSFVFSPVIAGTADSVIEGNIVQNNEVRDGGYTGTAGGIQGGGIIRGNIIRHNAVSAMIAAGGICSTTTGVGLSRAYLIEYNLIENNSAYSYGYGGYEPIAAGGILVSSGAEIRFNTIRSNQALVSSGDLTAGSIAISSDDSTQINYNNFQSNFAKYEIVVARFYLWEPTDVDASNNWWGTADEDSISGIIYDYYDDWTLGRIIYEPIAAAPISEAPRVTYDLMVNSTVGGGVTSPADGIHAYQPGTVVNLLATPDAGYRFVNWTGDVGTIAIVNAASTTITMNGDYFITANFEEIPDQCDLTISSTAGGRATTPGEATFTYDVGSVVTLVATADEGYRFVNWTGDADSIADVNAATTTITVNGNYSVTGTFEPVRPFPWWWTVVGVVVAVLAMFFLRSRRREAA